MAELQIQVNEYEMRRARDEFVTGLFGALDAKRPTAWTQYGWPEVVSFDQMLRAYERGGPGHGAVHRILDKCWQERPRIKQPDADEVSDWEKAVTKVISSINGWVKLRDFDRRNMVGRYAALIYRLKDGKKLSDPVTKGAKKLIDLVPCYENQISILKVNDDTESEDYGQPLMYQIKLSRIDQNGNPVAGDAVDVHPSRVQILAEGSVGHMADGVPLLKAGYNHLVDLEKISGGSGESFLKNSARTLSFKFAPETAPETITQNPDGTSSTRSVREVIEDQTRRLNRNLDSSIVTAGGDVTTLQTTISDPSGAFNLAANLFAASVQVPMTILFGAQTGRLASDEDKADMVARCKSRQINELTPMLEQFVTRMQAIGLIEAGDFEIEWSPLDAPGDKERLELVGMMADANLKAFQGGDQPVFNTNEQRKAAGYEELPGGDEMQTPEEKAADAAALQTEMAKEVAKAQPEQPQQDQQKQQPPRRVA